MEVYFLEAKEPLTKRFALKPDGKTIAVESYPHVTNFRSHVHAVENIEQFHALLLQHASKGHCLLKGQLTKLLTFESRAGSTDPYTPTEFIVLDVDGLPDHTPEDVLNKLNIPRNCDYIIQYSASQGVMPKKGLSCHIYIMLEEPRSPPQIKQWLIQQNLEKFDQYITLTASGIALHYPIDITACQNDKLIYIAPPICTPPSLDPLPPEERIKLIKGIE